MNTELVKCLRKTKMVAYGQIDPDHISEQSVVTKLRTENSSMSVPGFRRDSNIFGLAISFGQDQIFVYRNIIM